MVWLNLMLSGPNLGKIATSLVRILLGLQMKF